MKRKQRTGSAPTPADISRIVVLAGTMLSAFFAFTFYMAFIWQLPPEMRIKTPDVPPYFRHAEDGLPYPATLDPSLFADGPIRDAYAAARQWPHILVQQPSYCPAARSRSLLECFASLEATECAPCVNEALFAARLHQEGKAPADIRAAIIREYAPKAASQDR